MFKRLEQIAMMGVSVSLEVDKTPDETVYCVAIYDKDAEVTWTYYSNSKKRAEKVFNEVLKCASLIELGVLVGRLKFTI